MFSFCNRHDSVKHLFLLTKLMSDNVGLCTWIVVNEIPGKEAAHTCQFWVNLIHKQQRNGCQRTCSWLHSATLFLRPHISVLASPSSHLYFSNSFTSLLFLANSSSVSCLWLSASDRRSSRAAAFCLSRLDSSS